MEHPTAEQTFDIPIAQLPPVDEHSVEIAAPPSRTWEALVGILPRVFDNRRSRIFAPVLGSAHTEAKGEPSVIGSTLPGFVVARSVRPATLALLGQHRFSRYALVFCIDELGPGRSRLRAETRAEFPGRKGRAYRKLVIGSRGHIAAVNRILEAVRKRAERSVARVTRPQVTEWIAAYEEAWRSAGTEALDELFSAEADYSYGPYDRAHLGLAAIKEMWEAERTSHEETFDMHTEIVAVEGDTAVVRVSVHYEAPRQQEYRDLWIARFDGDGLCSHFEEWPYWPEQATSSPTRRGRAETI